MLVVSGGPREQLRVGVANKENSGVITGHQIPRPNPTAHTQEVKYRPLVCALWGWAP